MTTKLSRYFKTAAEIHFLSIRQKKFENLYQSKGRKTKRNEERILFLKKGSSGGIVIRSEEHLTRKILFITLIFFSKFIERYSVARRGYATS